MKTLSDLRQCRDLPALRAGLYELCRPYGSIKYLDILQSKHEGARQAICFLRMGTPSQEVALMHAFGVGRFGGAIAFVVDLDEHEPPAATVAAVPSSQWTDWGAL